MRTLKWTSIKEYIDLDTGEIITEREAKKYYIIIKKIKDYDYTTKIAKDTKEVYQTCKITYRSLCQRSKQQRLFDD